MLENIINTINAIFFHPWKGEEFFIHSTQYKMSLYGWDITKAAL